MKNMWRSPNRKGVVGPLAKSDPDFTQITAYLRTKTIEDVKIKLIKQGTQDVSDID
jgi:hypothetical protein